MSNHHNDSSRVAPAIRATLVGMPPTRTPAVARVPSEPPPPPPTRSQLVGIAAGGADDGDSLGAQCVEQICEDYLDLVVELHLAEQRVDTAEQRAQDAEQQLVAARAMNAGLERQLALKGHAFELRALRIDVLEVGAIEVGAPSPTEVSAPTEPSPFNEPTRRRVATLVRREPITKVIDVPCTEARS